MALWLLAQQLLAGGAADTVANNALVGFLSLLGAGICSGTLYIARKLPAMARDIAEIRKDFDELKNEIGRVEREGKEASAATNREVARVEKEGSTELIRVERAFTAANENTRTDLNRAAGEAHAKTEQLRADMVVEVRQTNHRVAGVETVGALLKEKAHAADRRLGLVEARVFRADP